MEQRPFCCSEFTEACVSAGSTVISLLHTGRIILYSLSPFRGSVQCYSPCQRQAN
jgi:hypothetical protein